MTGSGPGRTRRRTRGHGPLGAMTLVGLCACGVLVAATAHADSRALAGIPLPPAADSRIVASDIVQNGQLLSIATLEPHGTLEETLAFYREAWPASEGDPGHVVSRAGDWTVISRLLDVTTNLVVQLRKADAGTEGIVSAMSLVPGGASRVETPPMPAGGELLSTTETRDIGLVASTSVVASTARPGEVAGFYRDTLKRAGWRLVSDREAAGSLALLFDGRGARLELVVAGVDGGSVAVINEVKSDD